MCKSGLGLQPSKSIRHTGERNTVRLARTNHGPSFSRAVITFDLPARTSRGATAPTATFADSYMLQAL